MKFITQHLVYPVTIIIGLLALMLYVLWLQFKASSKAKLTKEQDKPQVQKSKFRQFSKLPDWYLN